MPTTRFSSWHRRTIRDLSVGRARAMTRMRGMIFFTSSMFVSKMNPSRKRPIYQILAVPSSVTESASSALTPSYFW